MLGRCLERVGKKTGNWNTLGTSLEQTWDEPGRTSLMPVGEGLKLQIGDVQRTTAVNRERAKPVTS